MSRLLAWLRSGVVWSWHCLRSFMQRIRRLLKQLEDSIDGYVNRVGDEIEPPSIRDYGSLGRLFRRNLIKELSQIPKEVSVLLGSVLSAFGLLAFYGFEPETDPVQFLLHSWANIASTFWNTLFKPLRGSISPALANLFTLQLLSCGLYLRGSALRESRLESVWAIDLFEHQKTVLMFVWLLFSLYAFYWLSDYGITRIDPSPAAIEAASWRQTRLLLYFIWAVVFFGGFSLTIAIVLFLLYLPYFKLVYQSAPMTWLRNQARESRRRFVLVNLAVIVLAAVCVIGLGNAERAFPGFETIFSWARGLLALTYLSLWASLFLVGFTYPRVVLALGALVLLIVVSDGTLHLYGLR